MHGPHYTQNKCVNNVFALFFCDFKTFVLYLVFGLFYCCRVCRYSVHILAVLKLNYIGTLNDRKNYD